MLVASLPPKARTALIALAAIVAAIFFLGPKVSSSGTSSTGWPHGVVVAKVGDQVTVRSAGGRTYSVTTDPGSASGCTVGRSFPSCTR